MMIDLLLNEDGSGLQWANNDFVLGESTQQHQRLLLVSQKGDFKENPTRCVGLYTWLKDDENTPGLLGDIKQEFEADGMKVKLVQLLNRQLTTDANY
jgi:hypothetical protein